MSLRAKLYISFAVMIVLVLLIGGVALHAFTTTQQRVQSTKAQVEYVDRELIPASNSLTTIATQITAAALNYYAFSYNAFPSDFKKGDEHLATGAAEVQTLENILDAAPKDHLPATRDLMPGLKRRLTELNAKSRELNACLGRIDSYRGDVETQIANMDKILNELFTEVMDDLNKSFLDEKREGMPPVVKRRFDRVGFLDELTDELTRGQMAFWEAQGNFGEAAAALFQQSLTAMNGTADKAEAYANSPAVGTRAQTKQSFLNLVAEIREYSKSIDKFAREWNESDRITKEITGIAATVLADTNRVSDLASKLVIAQTRAIDEATGAIDSTVSGAAWLSWLMLGASLVLGVGFAIFITGSITKPINNVIERLNHAESSIAGASSQIGEASHELADGANEQAAAIEQTSSALEQMASMTRQNADNAQQTNEKTRNTANLVSDGATAMEEMSKAMADISDKSDKVSQIIKTISDIAFQTNLLALNAAVEAARAGEAGKGFAVVADEVRNLSQRSAQAARDTSSLITSTVDSVRNGSEIAMRLTESFSGIEGGTRDISRLIEQIANATDEQAQGVDQVNTAMAQMDKVTQQNSASAASTASSSNELEQQVLELRDDIGLLLSIVYGAKSGGLKRLQGGNGKGDGKGNGKDRAARRPMLTGPSEPMVLRPDSVIPLDTD